ncbi:hypothetical protein C8J56DRAFT_963589, partial [Mycena floridula]
MSSTLTLCGFSEELIRQLVLLLVDNTDYEDRGYPDSTYNHASRDIVSLSLINRQLRRICLPFLFSFIACTSLEDIVNLQQKCLGNLAFARLVRTLQFNVKLKKSGPASEIILLLLPHLNGLLWLDLPGMPINKALMVAINNHPTVKTAVIWDVGELPPDVSLEKILLREAPTVNSVRAAIERGMRVASLELDVSTIQNPSLLYSSLLPGLRDISLVDSPQTTRQLEEFCGFVANHPTLKSIDFYSEIAFLPSSGTITNEHISSFMETAAADSLLTKIRITEVTMSSSGSSAGFESWVVTGLDLLVLNSSESLVKALRLAGTMFSHLSRLSIERSAALTIHINDLISVTSEYLPCLQILAFSDIFPSLISTPSQVPMYAEVTSSHDAAITYSRWIAWQFFQASPSLVCIYFDEDHDLDLPQPWTLKSSCGARRDYTGVLIRMEVRGTLRLSQIWASFRESMTADYQVEVSTK